ncbi:MAG: hypothetical protein PW788_04245 [Micavibrio sp.]|nr:hypothetical protein [Micavibrio sp.]
MKILNQVCLCTAALLFAATTAHAVVVAPPTPGPEQSPAVSPFACSEGFTLDKTTAGLHLHGQLAMPTPGYRYTFNQDDEQPTTGAVTGSLELDEPEGNALQVISPLDIDINMQTEGDVQLLSIGIDKEFDWGPDKITCQKNAATQGNAQ